MPLGFQTFVGGDGSAATEPPTSAFACPADKLPTELSQVLGLGIPLVLLATGWAAIALHPNSLPAAMHVILRLGASIFGGVPHVDDAGVVGQGASTGLSRFNFAEPCKAQRRAKYWQAGRHLITMYLSMCATHMDFPYSQRASVETMIFSELDVGQAKPQIGSDAIIIGISTSSRPF